jgi:hypothetical protein
MPTVGPARFALAGVDCAKARALDLLADCSSTG